MRQFQPGQPILHAYILAASDAALRETEATALAAAMLCTASGVRPCGQCRDCRKVFRGLHPDVICVDPASGSKRPVFKVDQIRDVSADAYIMPSEAQRKVYVLRQADTMNPAAQNALLKLLEEPPRSASFILAAERAESLLPTVRSRCEIIRCNTEADVLPEEAVQDAEAYLALLARGDAVGLLRFSREHERGDAEAIQSLLMAILRRLTAHLSGDQPLSGLSGADAIAEVQRIERCLEYLRSNVSARHIFGVLSLTKPNR